MKAAYINFAQTLRQIAHETGLALLLWADANTVQRYANQYHDTRQQLLTLLPDAAPFCTPLPADASAGSIRLAARTAAAYVERLLPTDPEEPPMDSQAKHTHNTSNTDIADALDTLANRLNERDANPHRVQAYRLAAETVRHHEQPLAEMLQNDGVDVLKTLPWIGDSLASRIAGFVETGHLRLLDDIRNAFQPKRLFTRVPGIGPELAQRLYDELGIETLEALEVAAHDGRLEGVEGFGRRRVRALRAQLNMMLGRQARRRAHRLRTSQPGRDEEAPSIADLLNVDLEYRYRSARNELHRIAPRRFNPEGEAWLPVLNTQRRPWRFTALFSNTARAHELEKTDDWVVIYAEHGDLERQYTVVTEARGELKGERVVRGREAECRTYYAERQAQAA
ncbi:MAG TPA: helix-hairpin-helix domain-containing protein [Rhodothermales bacterium]|nr:helix-hairpin-helix domain-containing protein [Rhodothermales bacterium]